MPVNPGSWDAKTKGWRIKTSLGCRVRCYIRIKIEHAKDVAQLVACLLSLWEALGSTPSASKNKHLRYVLWISPAYLHISNHAQFCALHALGDSVPTWCALIESFDSVFHQVVLCDCWFSEKHSFFSFFLAISMAQVLSECTQNALL